MLPIYARVFARLPADIPRRTFHKVKVIFPGLRFDAMKIFIPRFGKGQSILRIFEEEDLQTQVKSLTIFRRSFRV